VQTRAGQYIHSLQAAFCREIADRTERTKSACIEATALRDGEVATAALLLVVKAEVSSVRDRLPAWLSACSLVELTACARYLPRSRSDCTLTGIVVVIASSAHAVTKVTSNLMSIHQLVQTEADFFSISAFMGDGWTR